MGLAKRTYVLPPDMLEDFEMAVPAGERSGVVAELMSEWLERRRREELRRDVIEGCREMFDIYRETEREFHPLEEEVARALDA